MKATKAWSIAVRSRWLIIAASDRRIGIGERVSGWVGGPDRIGFGRTDWMPRMTSVTDLVPEADGGVVPLFSSSDAFFCTALGDETVVSRGWKTIGGRGALVRPDCHPTIGVGWGARVADSQVSWVGFGGCGSQWTRPLDAHVWPWGRPVLPLRGAAWIAPDGVYRRDGTRIGEFVGTDDIGLWEPEISGSIGTIVHGTGLERGTFVWSLASGSSRMAGHPVGVGGGSLVQVSEDQTIESLSGDDFLNGAGFANKPNAAVTRVWCIPGANAVLARIASGRDSDDGTLVCWNVVAAPRSSICEKCGHEVRDRPLLTGTFRGCLC